MMKVLLTGTHLTATIAVAEELKKQKNINLVYVGRKNTREGDRSPSIESQILPRKGIKFIPLTSGRLQRSFTIYTIPSLFKLPIGFIQAFLIILSEKPDVILSFGGYVSVPVVFAGWLLSIPIITHEQTLVSGLASRINSLFATKIAISFKNSHRQDKRLIFTGNPIRGELLEKSGSAKMKIFKVAAREHLPVILITGGNQGSHAINLAVEEILDKLKKIACIIHTSGDNKFNDFERLKLNEDNHYLVKEWIGEDWREILSKVDLAISRAGINTLMEFSFFQIPALVIPIPYLFADEQNKNAKYFEEIGLVKILPQSKLSGKNLLENIKEMIKNKERLKKDAEAAKQVVNLDAAKIIALETIILVQKNRI